MKRVAIALLAGVAAVAGVGYSASAADLAVKAAPLPPAPSWTGFYAGVHGGAAWQQARDITWVDPNFLLGVAGAVPSPVRIAGATNLGGVGGGQLGYNWQTWWPAWVIGVEGDISFASLSNHNVQSPAVFPTVAGIAGPGPGANAGIGAANFASTSLQASQNTEWLASLRGKLGFTGWLNNTMFYATGGIAWAQVEHQGSGVFFNGFTDQTQPNHSVRTGWVVGAGAEWMVTTNILLRAEYLFYNIHDNVTLQAPYLSPGFGVAAPTFAFSNYNVQVARIAGSYKF
jgi:outer membrane immunogenic protein